MPDALLGPEEEAVASMELRFQLGSGKRPEPPGALRTASEDPQRAGTHRVGGGGLASVPTSFLP